MKKILLVFSLVVIFSVSALAQAGGATGVSDPISAAMGNSYVTSSRGVYSIHKNPANLTFSPVNEFELATVFPLPTINSYQGTDFLSIEEYNYFFGGEEVNGQTVGRYLTQEDKDRLRGLFKDGGIISQDLAINYFAVSFNAGKEIGSFAFNIDANESFRFVIPQTFVDLALEGNPIGSRYNFDNLKFKANWIRNYTLSYARELTDIDFLAETFTHFSAGISLKMVHGFAHIATERVKSNIYTSDNQNQIIATGDFLAYAAFSPDFGKIYDFDTSSTGGNFGPFSTPAGTGFGFDIGFNAQLDDTWTFGLAFTDIGSITWDKNVAEYSSDNVLIIDDITDENALDSIANSITGEGKYYEGSITSNLPTAFRLGASCRVDKLVGPDFPGTLLVSTEINQGFNDATRNSTNTRFSLGLEYRPVDFLPIRTGFTFGGYKGFGWGFGTGIDAGLLEFAISTSRILHYIDGNQAQKLAFALGTRWRF